MKVNTVKFNTQRPYGAVVCSGATEYLPFALDGVNKVLVVSDEKVHALYGAKIRRVIKKSNAEMYSYTTPEGENGKSKAELDKLLILMTELNLLSTDCVIAFGGGTASDLAGFASAIYKRGIPCINIPTTLLSMCDAGVGGKSAINFLGRKNLLGLIRQPKAVFCDTDYLQSLSEKEKASGFAEIIKCAILNDGKSFSQMESGEFGISDGITLALKVKAKIVKADEYDQGKRKLLNFGHTFAHAIESVSGFSLSHGEAVAYGLSVASYISEKLKIAKGVKVRVDAVLNKYGLSTDINYDKEKIFEYVLADKKRQGDKIAMVLPKRIGKAVVKKISVEKLKELYLDDKNI